MKALRIGVVFWEPNDGMARETVEMLRKLGHSTVNCCYNERLPGELDVVFTSGPFDSLVPVGTQLSRLPVDQRPLFIWWLTEQLPNPRLPRWLVHYAGIARSRAERIVYSEGEDGCWQVAARWRWVTAKAHRFRYYGDLRWLQHAGVLSAVVTGSPWRAGYLRAFGFDPYVPSGHSYRPGWGADLNLERDVPVLWLGKTATRRRRRRLARLRKALAVRGVDMLVVDGVEHPYIFGEERTRLLNRTKIVVNLLRTDWDNHAGRFALAALNRCLIVTEPTLPHTSFEPGVHVVEAPIEQMADTICYYLANEAQRQQIAERAYQLIKSNSREAVLAGLLEHVTGG